MRQVDSKLLRKVAWRLVPLMALLYFANFLDRVNVGFAALTMNQDLGFSPSVFGTGGGILFIGYVLFQIPSNIALERFGVRLWIGSITVVWGLLSAAMALVSNATDFYVLRFLLGVAESGFFPGMILYLTYWFPYAERAKIAALFMIAIPASSALGAPISTAFLDVSGFGIKGWQWLFILQGIPSAILGICVFFFLTDKPARALWLSATERDALTAVLAAEPKQDAVQHVRLSQVLADPKVWLFGVIDVGITVSLYGLALWLPQIIKSLGSLTNAQVGLATALPYVLGMVSMYTCSAHADATGERRWHLAVPMLMGGAGLIASGFLIDRPVIAFLALMIASVGIYTALPAFWSIPKVVLNSRVAAPAIALINAVGAMGGFLGPHIIGVVKEATGSYAAALMTLAVFAIAGAVLALVIGPKRAPAAAAGSG